MSDPANEGRQEFSCEPQGTTTYRKYGVYRRSGTNDWFTHTVHPDANVYLQTGCVEIIPETPFSPAEYMPTPRPAHSKDYMSNGRQRLFISNGTSPDYTRFVRVSRND